MEYPGYIIKDKRIYYIDACEKDAGIERWRVHMYYHPNYADTKYFATEKSYRDFIDSHKKYCFRNYDDFKNSYETSKCGCMSHDPTECWALRYNIPREEVAADGGPCQCVCHDEEEERREE